MTATGRWQLHAIRESSAKCSGADAKQASETPRRRGRPRKQITVAPAALVAMTEEERQRAVRLLAELLLSHLEQKGKRPVDAR